MRKIKSQQKLSDEMPTVEEVNTSQQQEKKPILNTTSRKTYIVSVVSDDIILIKSVIIAMDVFDALRKCSMRFKDEECEIACVTVQIEETEVIE